MILKLTPKDTEIYKQLKKAADDYLFDKKDLIIDNNLMQYVLQKF